MLVDVPLQVPAPRASSDAPLCRDQRGDAASAATLLLEAEEFLRLRAAEEPDGADVEGRLRQVRESVLETGTYEHTEAELAFGARVAWRNSLRCVGRLYWRSLVVRDRREVGDAAGVARDCVEHIEFATNGGRIRPVITVFAPDRPGRPGPRIRNDQLIRYAGYRSGGGPTLGDPQNVALTDDARALGWRPPSEPGRFDVLPLIVQGAAGPARLFELPARVVLEVAITHPELPALAGLGLRWHALPVISGMRLRIGGVDYPAAPFNGWYMGTEIGARNLGDCHRYDVLPAVGEMIGLDMSSDRTLWRDRALVELNRAVLHSFQQAGVTMSDHHTETRRFLMHLQREERAGRTCPADWSWIVPPMSGSQTPVFHRYYDTRQLLPAFLPAAEPPSRTAGT